jgi:phosphatidylglycerophosphate synthase
MRNDEFFYEFLLPFGGFIVVVVVVLIVILSFLAEVARLLRRVEPNNRRMEPGQVWLNLIPVFNVIWVTVTIERVAESLRAEFTARGLHGPDEKYGRKTGLTVLALLVSAVPLYPVAIVTYPLAFGYWMAYWKHLNRYAARLKSGAYTPPPTEEGW